MNYAEIAAMPTRGAFRALASEWHDMTEAGCCGDGERFCGSSENWARGYLAAIADAEAAVSKCIECGHGEAQHSTGAGPVWPCLEPDCKCHDVAYGRERTT